MHQDEPYKEELDFRDLLRRPHKLFGYSYLYLLGVVLLVGILYAQRLTEIGKAGVVPVAIADTSAGVVDIALQAPQNIPPVDLAMVASPTAALLERGRDLYGANCSSCHGATGLGDGPSASTLKPPPRNFHTTEAWTNGRKITEIYITLHEGITRNGMASFSYLPPADRFALVHFVRSFVPAPPVESLAELQQLESRYQLSKGIMVPAKVPVRVAARKIVTEYEKTEEKIARATAAAASSSEPGAKLYRRLVSNPRRMWTAVLAGGSGLLGAPASEFVPAVASDPMALGFAGGAARLTAEEYASLQRFIESVARESQNGR